VITPMVKVTFMGPKGHLMEVMDLLHSLGVVHLEPYPIEDPRLSYIRIPSDEKSREELLKKLDSLHEKVGSLLVALKKPSEPSTVSAWLFDHNISRADIEGSVSRAEDQITPPYDHIMELRNELSLLKRYERVLAALYPLLDDAIEVQHLELMGIIVEKKRVAVLPLLEKELSRITEGRFRLFTRDMDRDNLAAILAYPGESEPMIRTFFSEESIAEIRLPAGYEDKPLATTLRLLMKRQRELPKLIAKLGEELEDLSLRWYGTLTRIRMILRERIDEFATMSMSAQSRHAFFLRGWVPEEKLHMVFESVNSSLENIVQMEVVPARFHERDHVPVQLKNSPFAKVFEPLVGIVALPKYGTLDPTPYMAVFFPIFFGFILGDIAYGMGLFALSIWLHRRFAENPFIRSVSVVFMISGISATIFGLFFGEFFGDLGEHWGLHPLLMDRAHLFLPLLFIAIGLGFVHVILGFFLNMVISIRHGHRRHWIASLASMASLCGFAAVIGHATGYFPMGDLLGGFLLLLGVPALILSEGFMGPLELLKSCGNILSYARLMAIGVSSVILAQVANTIGGILGSLAVGIMVALIFHGMNFVLGVFSPTIHSLRLHYVEFFSKFFQPGGKPYEPFRRYGMPWG